jgi:hypothetical protein
MTANIIKCVGVVVFFIGLILPLHSYAQDSKLGNWLIYLGNKKLNKTWDIHHEVQYRNYNTVGDLEQLLLRTGLGYSFNDNKNNLLLGYGYILSENYLADGDEKIAVNEHRIFQQFISKQHIHKVSLNHRYRFEQRFVERDFKMRFRYFLGINIPLTNREINNFYISSYNEIFLNSNSAVFDRNRLYGGVGLKINEHIKLELGYMNQFFETNNRDQLNVLAFINF